MLRGVVIVIIVKAKTVKSLAATPPIVLPVAPVKSVPVSVELVPPLTVRIAGELKVRDGTAASWEMKATIFLAKFIPSRIQ